jgi:Flp pilus assembly protein TadG
VPSVSGDRGSITAEFAAVIPAVMLVLAGCLVCLQLGSQQLRLQDAAAVTARALARGDTAPSYAGAALATSQSGDLLCATLTLGAQPPLFVELRAQSCAIR